MLTLTNYLLILGMLCVSNILLGMFYNINIQDFNFDKIKLLNGIVKILIIMFSTYSLYYAFICLPQLSEALGVDPCVIMVTAIVAYTSKVVIKLSKIFGISKEVKKKEEV